MPVRAPTDVLLVEPVDSDVFLQKYILHLHRYFTYEDHKYKYKIYLARAAADVENGTNKC